MSVYRTIGPLVFKSCNDARMPSCRHGLMNQKEDKDNKRSVFLLSHTNVMLIFAIFSAIG